MAEDYEQDDEQAGSSSPSPSVQSEPFMDNENDSRGSSVTSNVSQPDRSKKRKRLLTTKGGDFWSMVEMWFTARMKPDQLGPSLSTPGWTQYVLFFKIIFSLT